MLLAVRAVNGKFDRLVLAVITRRDTDYRLSATQPVQSCCWRVHTSTHIYTRTDIKIRENIQRCKSKEIQRKSPSALFEWLWYTVKCESMCVFQYRPVEAQAGLCGRQQGEVRGVRVRGSL